MNCSIFICAGLLLMEASSRAMITQHGREPLSTSAWALGLDQVINHASRVSGTIGPVGPSAHFCFAGDATTLNQVLLLYAKSQQKEHVLYLTSLPADGDFQLSVTHNGSGFLHLYAGGKIDLRALKVPPSVQVEVTPAVNWSSNPEIESERQRVEKAIREFIAARSKRS